MTRLRALWTRLKRWYVDPFPAKPSPDKKGHRAAPIDLLFHLYPDGTVYWVRRRGDGHRKVTEDVLIAMVHTEYRALVEDAKRRMRFRKVVGR